MDSLGSISDPSQQGEQACAAIMAASCLDHVDASPKQNCQLISFILGLKKRSLLQITVIIGYIVCVNKYFAGYNCFLSMNL